ncbi:MAG: HAMP domain-containing protein [Deltaproteobacteria bacterium]|nr:HAMP domain-containing protein [Deltaproteobacteria bacterium]
MSSKKAINLRRSLAFRLTLWYAGIFTATTFLAFFLLYVLITQVIEGQTDQDLANQMRKFASLVAVEGTESIRSVAIAEAQAGGVKKFFFRFLYHNGQVFHSSNMDYWQDIKINRDAIVALIKSGRPVFETVIIDKRTSDVRILYGFIGRGVILQVGQSREEYSRFLAVLRDVFILTVAGFIIAAAFIGWFMARRALSGVATVTATARSISRDALTMRVPLRGRDDEIDQLASTFNDMLDRIERLVMGMKEMSDNIAHDLKSPVTRIRGIAEITLTTGKTVDEFEAMGASIIEESDRLLEMINTMLVISRIEAGVGAVEKEELDLSILLREACELFHPMAEDKNIDFTCQVPSACVYSGNLGNLQRMIANLVDNAIKYTPQGGRVALSLSRTAAGAVTLEVKDNGIGIAAKDLPHIFERFYRCDQSRSQEGVGLGLSLARTIARAHGGDITLASAPGEGAAFTVTL